MTLNDAEAADNSKVDLPLDQDPETALSPPVMSEGASEMAKSSELEFPETMPTDDDTPQQVARPRVAVDRGLVAEIKRRRTFAIISHPDAGKTTLTEKLLLYAGQMTEAGAVRGRKTQRAVTSDWMQMERERGISITSTVLSFEYLGHQLNLLDTPGHNDFSEDTYRTLTAADCAVMVLDVVKGIEPQTMKLFKICAERKIPIVTFVNKLDRPGADPLGVLGKIEDLLKIHAVPMNWPIGLGKQFCGVYDLALEQALLFQSVAHGSTRVPTTRMSLEDACRKVLPQEVASQLRDEVSLLSEAGEPFDRERFLNGEMTPVFFGSALTNFGLERFLESFIEIAPSPGPRMSDVGPISPEQENFSGVIFKIQANLDPRHHDRVAFLRVCSGRFTREMETLNSRTMAKIRVKRSHRAFAQERETMDEAFPGDILGLVIPGQLRLGDTLCVGPPIKYEGRWHFPPECFATIRCDDTTRRKQFVAGLSQLREEGAVQEFMDESMSRERVIGAVGDLQFEVVQFRLESEHKTRTVLQRLPYSVSRWITGDPADIASMRVPSSARTLVDEHGDPLIVFETEWFANYCAELNPRLTFHVGRPVKKLTELS
ncbi:MAG: peptide chain release factor 3 [Planctomycetaceae bacterium]